jgi:hypothetical protein
MLLFAFGLIAQTTTSGDVAGTVTDPSGAVVPNAPVTLVNDATGQTINVTTNNSGFYRASSLKPGAYTVAATVQGFAPSKRRVDVAVGTITTINLPLGNVSAQTTVEVTAEAPVIQTENGNISNTHDTREIELVPNGGGDTSYVAQTTPGITMNTATGTGYGNFSAFGLPGTANLFTTNGNDAMDPYLNLNNSGATNLTLGANELAEVSVVSNGYSVQYGRQAGAQVNSVTKSGSNGFHGNAVYYWNGRAMNADNWFNKHVDAAAGQTPTPTGFVNANQWSGSFGGPIKKDKTFFFVDTEGLRIVVPVPAQVFTPTQAFENYILTTALPGNGQSVQIPFYQRIFNIYNSAPGNGNSRPVNATDDPSLGCGDLAGTPGVAFGTTLPCAQTYHSDFPNFAHEWTLAARVDHQLTSADRLYVRYHMDRGLQPTYTDPLTPTFNTNSSQPSYDGQFNETHAFGTKAVNQFILSGAYYRAIFVSNNQAQALAAYPSSLIFGDGLFANVGGVNFNFPQGRNVTQYQVVDDLSINLGNHTLKVGTNYRRNDITDFTTGVLTVPEQLVLSMTDFTQGVSDFLRERFPTSPSNPVAIWSAGWYGEDDWRATDRLKLTLGLRIDHDSNPVCQTNCFSRLAQPFQSISKGSTVPYNQVIQSGVHQAYRGTDPLLWQPRIGFAWQPFGSGRSMVIRGGAGLFYDLVPGTLADNFINTAPGNVDLRDQLNGNAFAPGVPGSTYTVLANSATAFRQQFASGGSFSTIKAAVPLFTGLTYQDATAKTKTPQFQEWNLEIQQGIGAKTSVSANYVGNHGIHIPVYDGFINARCASATGCANVRSVLPAASPDSAFTSVRQLEPIGYSHYNGIVLALQRKFSAGLQAQFSYTWSHATDTVSNGGVLPWSIDDSLQTLISPFGQDLNYGNADYDARHSLNANYVYELPFKFGNGFVNNLIGGWTVSGNFFYHTGFPFTVTDSTALTSLVGNGTGLALPANIASSVNFMACSNGPSIDVNAPGCLSKSQFKSVNSSTFPIPGYFSNQRRNQFIGPHYFNTDLSLRKAFKLTERFRLSVGANAYNVLNHPNFGNPTATLSGSTGSFYTTVAPPTSALGAFLGGDASARSVQLEGRLTF